MTDLTNPVGSEQQPQGTIQEAANSFLGLLEPEEAPEEGQAEESQEPEVDLSGETEPVDEQEEDDSQESEPQSYRIKVGGEEQDLTYDELVSLAQQGADYTKKRNK